MDSPFSSQNRPHFKFITAKLFFVTFTLAPVAAYTQAAEVGLATNFENAVEETITIGADPWCPYTCFESLESPGYMIEVAKEIFAEHNIKVNFTRVNWARAVQQAGLGKLTAIAGAAIADAPDLIFPKVALGYSGTCFYTLKSNPWKFETIESLKKTTIGIVHGYSYVPHLDKYFEENSNTDLVQKVTGDEAIEINMKKLLAKRIESVVMGDDVARYTLSSMGIGNKIKEAGCTTAEEVHIAFSPVVKHSKKYAEMLSVGITRLRKEGRLGELLGKYNLADWEKN